MEAIWSRFFPAYDLLRKELSCQSVGEVVQLQANFGVFLEAARVK